MICQDPQIMSKWCITFLCGVLSFYGACFFQVEFEWVIINPVLLSYGPMCCGCNWIDRQCFKLAS